MTSSLTLHAMAALLRQGRRIASVSWLLAAAAIAWLLIVALGCRDQPPFAFLAIAASLAAALAQMWFAMRVDFDVRLFEAAASQAPDDAAAGIDATLLELGLIADAAAGRDWPARWRGARGLLRRQAICLALQAIALAAALAGGGQATCWNV